MPGYGVKPKSKIGAALLAFFFGFLGIHNFYLGYTGKGATQLCLVVLAFFAVFTIILIPISAIVYFAVGLWAFIEFIMILVGGGRYDHDARGVPLV